MHLHKAVGYLKAVVAGERCIPFKRFLAESVVLARQSNSNRPRLKVDGQRNRANIFSDSSKTPNLTPKLKALMLTPSSLTTSRLTLRPSNVAVPTERTVASTLTWLPHATSKSSFLKRRRLFPVPLRLERKRFPRRS